MPILKSARRIVVLAVELPEPFTVPTVIEKSFVILSSISAPLCAQAERANVVLMDWAMSQQIHMADEGLASGGEVAFADRFDHPPVVVPDLPQILDVASVQV